MCVSPNSKINWLNISDPKPSSMFKISSKLSNFKTLHLKVKFASILYNYKVMYVIFVRNPNSLSSKDSSFEIYS